MSLSFGNTPATPCRPFAPEALQELTGKPGKGRRLAQRFLSLIRPVRFSEAISQDATLDLRDSEYLRTGISALLRYFVPEYELPLPLEFEVVEDREFITLRTNVDFAIVNRYYNRRVLPRQNSLSAPLLLGVLAAAREDIGDGKQE